MKVYTSVRPSICLPRQCLQKGLVCLPLSLSACVPYITFVDDAATPPCIHTSWLGLFFFFLPLGLLRDRFNCSRIFTKQKQAVVAAVRQTGRALGKQPEFALKCFFFFTVRHAHKTPSVFVSREQYW